MAQISKGGQPPVAQGGRNSPSGTNAKAQGSRNAPCPEGKPNCENKVKNTKRKPSFRVPLKKEDGNMESQIIEYNCEYPNRVVVRLEYLMQSTRVRLNDRHYMDDLYEKLLEEERRALRKATRAREKAEMNRMKKLIIDGMMKDIPPELYYLNRHPVFRVNQMLARLKTYDSALGAVIDNEEITPVEPYEYDGNQFFRNLHETGTSWVPSFQRIHDVGKLNGKIRRAKLRLFQKRKEDALEEKLMRLLNVKEKPNAEITKGLMVEMGSVGGTTDESEDEILNRALKMETGISKTTLSKREMYADKLQAKSRQESHAIQDKIKHSKARDLERDAALDKKRQEHEKDFHDTKDYEKIHIISRYAERVKQRNVKEIFERADYADSKRKLKSQVVKPYEHMFAQEDKGGTETEKNIASEDPLFRKMRKIYDVPGNHPFHHYEQYENEFIFDYLDNAQDGEQLMDIGDEITEMYTRQQDTAEDYALHKLDLNKYGFGSTDTGTTGEKQPPKQAKNVPDYDDDEEE